MKHVKLFEEFNDEEEFFIPETKEDLAEELADRMDRWDDKAYRMEILSKISDEDFKEFVGQLDTVERKYSDAHEDTLADMENEVYYNWMVKWGLETENN